MSSQDRSTSFWESISVSPSEMTCGTEGLKFGSDIFQTKQSKQREFRLTALFAFRRQGGKGHSWKHNIGAHRSLLLRKIRKHRRLFPGRFGFLPRGRVVGGDALPPGRRRRGIRPGCDGGRGRWGDLEEALHRFPLRGCPRRGLGADRRQGLVGEGLAGGPSGLSDGVKLRPELLEGFGVRRKADADDATRSDLRPHDLEGPLLLGTEPNRALEGRQDVQDGTVDQRDPSAARGQPVFVLEAVGFPERQLPHRRDLLAHLDAPLGVVVASPRGSRHQLSDLLAAEGQPVRQAQISRALVRHVRAGVGTDDLHQAQGIDRGALVVRLERRGVELSLREQHQVPSPKAVLGNVKPRFRDPAAVRREIVRFVAPVVVVVASGGTGTAFACVVRARFGLRRGTLLEIPTRFFRTARRRRRRRRPLGFFHRQRAHRFERDPPVQDQGRQLRSGAR
mmetsp:Transcript_7617/g.18747  ORF Transcript_7617/g.18747 Transcript_7617/m.18747 type:complete len:450 (+) Transcript_7617:474-1823(+)